MKHIVDEIRGIPLWLMREYLEEAGGQAMGDDQIIGDGWAARLTQMEPFRLGSLSVGQVKLELEGEEEAIACVMTSLEPKLMRAGG